MRRIRRALISLSDKMGAIPFAAGLIELDIELISTGGTAAMLRDAGLPVREVSDFTGFPEMLDGRVKTLHPKVHAGLLHRRDVPGHVSAMKAHGLEAIDLLCVNLYPFEETVARPGVTFEEAIEQIDIGGPAMLRSAAKNMEFVTVVCDPSDYGRVLDSIRANGGDTTVSLRRELAGKVFHRVATYNQAIADYLDRQAARSVGFRLEFGPGAPLRYGENPHQPAAFYRGPLPGEATIAHAEVLHGKEMSYNNYVDGDAALEAVKELSGVPAVAIVKHTNPCGFATGSTLAEAFEAAWAGDPVSAFGSVIAVTQPVALDTARCLQDRFVEVLIAPDFSPEALQALQSKSKQLRLLRLHRPCSVPSGGTAIRQINGGLLVQDRDTRVLETWSVPTRAGFPAEKRALAEFGIKVCKHVKSNAILIVREYAPGRWSVLGMGAGQPNRVDAVRKLAVTKARENIQALFEAGRLPAASLEDAVRETLAEAVLISDAFFPFADNIQNAHEAGLRYLVQPGGSKRDEDVIAACDAAGIAMAFTGMRHFRH